MRGAAGGGGVWERMAVVARSPSTRILRSIGLDYCAATSGSNWTGQEACPTYNGNDDDREFDGRHARGDCAHLRSDSSLYPADAGGGGGRRRFRTRRHAAGAETGIDAAHRVVQDARRVLESADARGAGRRGGSGIGGQSWGGGGVCRHENGQAGAHLRAHGFLSGEDGPDSLL